MHHEDIKASIRKSGTSPAAIARKLKVTSATVSNVIRGTTKSARIAGAISQVTGKSFSVLWPDKYPAQQFAEGMGVSISKITAQQAEADLSRLMTAKAPRASAPRRKVAA